jgi:hypothetical protein
LNGERVMGHADSGSARWFERLRKSNRAPLVVSTGTTGNGRKTFGLRTGARATGGTVPRLCRQASRLQTPCRRVAAP